MATKRQRTETTTTNNFEKAQGFLRLYLVDSEGGKHRLPKDLALYIKNNVSNAMIEKAKEDGDFTFTLEGTVNVVDDNEPKQIKL